MSPSGATAIPAAWRFPVSRIVRTAPSGPRWPTACWSVSVNQTEPSGAAAREPGVAPPTGNSLTTGAPQGPGAAGRAVDAVLGPGAPAGDVGGGGGGAVVAVDSGGGGPGAAGSSEPAGESMRRVVLGRSIGADETRCSGVPRPQAPASSATARTVAAPRAALVPLEV